VRGMKQIPRAWRTGVMALMGCLVAALALAACGSSSSGSSSSSTASTASTAATPASTSSATASSGTASWCGSKSITLGIQDGGGLNAWSAASLAQVKQEAAECPAVKKEIVVDAGFDPQKAVSGLQSMIAQGANAIVVIPDSGVCAELPAMRQATGRGIKVATWASNPCGSTPADYQSYTDQNSVTSAKVALDWVAKQMGGKGNLLYLGGPAGNTVDQDLIKGMYQALKAYPNIHVLDNVTTTSWPVTDWSTAQAEKTTSGLLAKYPTINGVMDMYGADAIGDVAAFKQAGRKMVPIVTTQLNSLSCEWAKLPAAQRFPLADESNRNWMGRLAVRQAVSAANGLSDSTPQSITLPLLENSAVPSMAPKCYSQGPNYDPSNSMTDAQVLAAASK
jgi:ribose transport system substrate-binding protein